MGALFRSDAIDFARQRLGNPVNNFGVGSWIIVSFMVAVFATATAFICTAHYTKRETILGAVVPGDGVLKVSPVRSGIIRDVLVRSGDAVHKGQPLFTVSYDVMLEDGAGLAGRINASTAAQTQAATEQGRLKKAQVSQERAALLAKRDGLDADAGVYRQQQAIQADRVALLENTVASSRQLFEQKYMSAVQLRQREDALLEGRQSLVQIGQSLLQTENQIRQIDRQLEGLTLQISEADSTLALTRSQMEEKRLTGLSEQGGFIVAARDGRITSLQSRTGDVVAAGQTLAMIVPASTGQRQLVHLWAPSRAVGFVREGARVRLMFDAFPYQTFGVGGGKVVEVSTAPILPNELPIPIETNEQMYRIVVALDRNDLTAYGRNWPLTPGMRLTADLVLDERSLLDWLLDPLLAATRRNRG